MVKGGPKQSRDDRQRIATKIVELSDKVLSTEVRKHHIALKIGGGSYSNAVIVTDSDYVKFFIRSKDLLNWAEKDFSPKLVKGTGPWAGFGYRFHGLGLSHIEAHEGLFKALVQESIKEIEYRKGKMKR